jgi:multidrug efflux pump subunit AcrA (membrane-fusion protein)
MSEARQTTRWRIIGIIAVIGVLGVVGGVWGYRAWQRRHSVAAADRAHAPGTTAEPIPVNVGQPRLDSSFSMNVTQPAYVEPYYRIELRARVAGPVVTIRKAIGDRVSKDEELITISVPDVEQEVLRKQAVVTQREHELEVAQAQRLKADADVKIAYKTEKVKLADVRMADAETSFRQQELERFRVLAQKEDITANIVAERQKYYEAGAAASDSARAMVEVAKANELGAQAKLKEAIADEKLKESLIEVAKKDLAASQELLKLATLVAPFDGVVTQRTVDPGSFVQNSAGSPGPGLLTIEKTDLVTISMSLPDTYAPYVDDGTEAIIEMSELPGVLIQARVSRYSKSLNTHSNDRTMRVEVDLFNRGPKSWQAFLDRQRANQAGMTENVVDLLQAGISGHATTPWTLAQETVRLGQRAGEPGFAELKGGKLPIFPTVSDHLKATLGISRLLPGMYGNMKLVLRNFKNARLIPSQAVFTRGGTTFIYLVRDGVARLTPVDVQVEDGILVKIAILDLQGKVRQRREPTDADRIVLDHQSELSDGQAVIPTLVNW